MQVKVKQFFQEVINPSHRMMIVLFAVALVFAISFYTFHLKDDLFGDERNQTFNVISVGNFWTNIQDSSMCHPPLYFLLAKISYALVGRPWAVRIPSIIFSIGTIVLVSFFAAHILGPRFFLPAAWLAVFSPFVMEFASEGRAYAMLIFFSIALIWSFHKFLKHEQLRTSILLVFTSICGALTHFFFWFELAFVWIYYLATQRRITRYSFTVLLICFIFLFPIFYHFFISKEAGFTNYLQIDWSKTYFSPMNFLLRLPIAIAYGYNTFKLPSLDPGRNISLEALKNNWILGILVILSFVGIGWGWYKTAQKNKHLFLFLFSGIGIPIVLSLIAGKAGFYLIREKHLAIIWVCYFILLLLSFKFLVKTKLGLISIAFYFIVVFVSIVHYIAFPDEYSRRMNWTGLNHFLERNINYTDIFVFYGDDLENLSLGKMKISERNIVQINLSAKKENKLSLTEFSEILDQNIKGKIFLINNETTRHGVDPDNQFIKSLLKVRKISERRFGRNLVLYEFNRY